MDLNTMTFGVEIETSIPTSSLTAQNWVVGGFRAGRNIPGFPGWQAMHDGSIVPSIGHRGVEVVSPVLQGIEGLNAITAMVAKLNEMGAKVNRSTGFHVHVGFSNDAQALVRLIFLTANVEPALFAATGSQARVSSTYTKSIKAGFAAVQAPGSVNTLRKLQTKVTAVSDRYHVLNVVNLINGNRPTVEFRVFAGTLNATKMRAYVQISLGLVQLAVENPRRVKWNAAPRVYAFGTGGEAEVKRLFVMLGWAKNASVSYSKDKAFGVLDVDGLRQAKRLLVQLGRKFDGGVRRGDVTVDD